MWALTAAFPPNSFLLILTQTITAPCRTNYALRRGGRDSTWHGASGRPPPRAGHPPVSPVICLCPEPTPAFPRENHTSFIMSSLKRLSALVGVQQIIDHRS